MFYQKKLHIFYNLILYMKKQLKHYEDIALSDKDVTDLLDNQVKISNNIFINKMK